MKFVICNLVLRALSFSIYKRGRHLICVRLLLPKFLVKFIIHLKSSAITSLQNSVLIRHMFLSVLISLSLLYFSHILTQTVQKSVEATLWREKFYEG